MISSFFFASFIIPVPKCLQSAFPLQSPMGKYGRWVRPEVYPLVGAVTLVVGLCALHLGRSICFNPDVRVDKRNRGAGVLDNHDEGEKYGQHFVRKFVRNRKPEIMPNVNNFFSDHTKN